MLAIKKITAPRNWLPLLVILGITAVWTSRLLSSFWIVQAVLSILFVLLLPGFFLYRIITGRTRQSALRLIINAVGLSLFFTMVATLILNQYLLALGDTQPLTTQNLTLLLGIATGMLAILAQIRAPLRIRRASVRSIFKFKKIAFGLVLLLPPLLAVGGATTLNNGGGNWLALTALGFSAVLLLVAVWQRRALDNYLPFILYSVALAILLGTSMRGWNITGHDVTQEFQVFELTLQNHLWSMAFYQDAYNACLSITILPTVLQLLTGISDQYVFKAIFPLFIALTVPALYLMLRHHVSRKIAFLAATVFMTFSPFVVDFTMLNRQTTAFLFFMLALQAALNVRLGHKRRTILTFLFLTGMVLSHYSSSYVGLSILIITTVLGCLVSVFGRVLLRRRIIGAYAIFSPTVVIAAVMVLFIWNTFVTQTSNNIAQTIQGIEKSIPSLLSGKGISQNSSRVGASGSGIVPAYAQSLEADKALPSTEYYQEPIRADYQVIEKAGTVQPVVSWLRHFGVSADIMTKFYSLARSTYTVFILVLAAAGIVLMMVKRKQSKLPIQYPLLGISALVLIGLQVVLPSSAINYGLLRVIQQGLIVLSLPIIIVAISFLRSIRLSLVTSVRIVGTGLVVVFLLMIGVLSSLTGGDKPALPLSNSGFYYEAYVTHQTDIAGFLWLKDETPQGSRIYADEFARRQLITYGGIFAQPGIIPQELPIDSYVIVSTSNTTFKIVPFYYQGILSYYTVPYKFLDANKNLVYSSQSVRIYK